MTAVTAIIEIFIGIAFIIVLINLIFMPVIGLYNISLFLIYLQAMILLKASFKKAWQKFINKTEPFIAF